MILKQNCFIISQHALNSLNYGTYQYKPRYEKTGQIVKDNDGNFKHSHYGLVSPEIVESPVSYAGSSLQRNRDNGFTLNAKESILSMFNRDMVKCKKTVCRKDAYIEHTLSKKSRIKIANKITAWTRANKLNNHKGLYNFITLTLTSKQRGTDKDFTKMLNTFFTYCRKYYNLKNYLYVLERQSKNTNNIHAHILIDRYVNYEHLNRTWCKVLGSNGYTFQQKNFETGEVKTVNVYDALKIYSDKNVSKIYNGSFTYPHPKTGNPVKPTRTFSKPNPCDVQTVYSLKAVSVYITKYVTKNDSSINTNLWNCSNSISKLWTTAIVNPLHYYADLQPQTDKVLTIKLDNGFVLLVNLLRYYTQIQQKIFKINTQFIC